MGRIPPGSIAGNIFDSVVFRELYHRLRAQPRIARLSRVSLEPARAADRVFVLHARAGYPLIFESQPVDAEARVDHRRLIADVLAGTTFDVRVGSYDRPDVYAYERAYERMPVADYVGRLDRPDGPPSGYAANQGISIEQARALGAPPPQFVAAADLEPPSLWLGAENAVTPLHKDSTDNFAVHLFGAKRWTLYPVRDAPHLALRRTVDQSDYADFAPSLIDWRAPDRVLAPSFDDAIPIIDEVVRGGETLYVPAGWAHHVESLEPSLMINYWVNARRRPPFALAPPHVGVRALETMRSREEALQLRYAVHYEEQRDARYADHTRRVWTDANDERDDVVLFGAFDGDLLVGTLRLTPRAGKAFIADDAYEWQALALKLGVSVEVARNGACLMDRVTVAATHRRTGVMRAMAHALAMAAVRRELPFVVSAAESHKGTSVRTLTALGYAEYGAVTDFMHFFRDLRAPR